MVAHAARRVVLSYGMGCESTAVLLRWLEDPSSRDFDLSDAIILTAMVGDEFADTGAPTASDSSRSPAPVATRPTASRSSATPARPACCTSAASTGCPPSWQPPAPPHRWPAAAACAASNSRGSSLTPGSPASSAVSRSGTSWASTSTKAQGSSVTARIRRPPAAPNTPWSRGAGIGLAASSTSRTSSANPGRKVPACTAPLRPTMRPCPRCWRATGGSPTPPSRPCCWS